MPSFGRASTTSVLLGSALVVTALIPHATNRAAAIEFAGRDHIVAPDRSAEVAPPVATQAPRSATAVPQAQAELRPSVVARIGGVELYAPSPMTAVAGFHEGSTRSLALEPVGTGAGSGHQPGDHATQDAPFVVMGSRGRPAPATSAVDLAVAPDEALASPVTGTVVGISSYALYGEVTDLIVDVRPDADPSVVVRIFHLVDPSVEVGQHLTAGETPLAAAARLLPFASQVDEYTAAPLPHVHIQVDRA